MADTGSLTFGRASQYVDGGVKYLVEIDGQPQAPRLTGSLSVTAIVDAGEHVVRLSIGRRKYFEARVTVLSGQARQFAVVPGPVLSGLSRQPRLIEMPSGTSVAGTIGRRPHPIDDPEPRHLPPR